MIEYCPRCNRQVVRGKHTGDYIHNCDSGNLALDQEDVVLTSTWDGGSADNLLLRGITNKRWGQRSQYGGKDDNVTKRGVNAETHRQRQHQEYIGDKDCL